MKSYIYILLLLCLSFGSIVAFSQDVRVIQRDSVSVYIAKANIDRHIIDAYLPEDLIIDISKFDTDVSLLADFVYEKWVACYNKQQLLVKQKALYNKLRESAKLRLDAGDISLLDWQFLETDYGCFKHELRKLELQILKITRDLKLIYNYKGDLFPAEDKIVLMPALAEQIKIGSPSFTSEEWKILMEQYKAFDEFRMPLNAELKRTAKLLFENEEIGLAKYMDAVRKATKIHFDFIDHVAKMNCYYKYEELNK